MRPVPICSCMRESFRGTCEQVSRKTQQNAWRDRLPPSFYFVGLPLTTSSKGRGSYETNIDFLVCRKLVRESVLLLSSYFAQFRMPFTFAISFLKSFLLISGFFLVFWIQRHDLGLAFHFVFRRDRVQICL